MKMFLLGRTLILSTARVETGEKILWSYVRLEDSPVWSVWQEFVLENKNKNTEKMHTCEKIICPPTILMKKLDFSFEVKHYLSININEYPWPYFAAPQHCYFYHALI